MGQDRTEGRGVASLSQRALQVGARLFIYHQLPEGSLSLVPPGQARPELQLGARSQPAHCRPSPGPPSQRIVVEKGGRPLVGGPSALPWLPGLFPHLGSPGASCVMPEPTVGTQLPPHTHTACPAPGKGCCPCAISKHGVFNSSFLWGWTPPTLCLSLSPAPDGGAIAPCNYSNCNLFY